MCYNQQGAVHGERLIIHANIPYSNMHTLLPYILLTKELAVVLHCSTIQRMEHCMPCSVGCTGTAIRLAIPPAVQPAGRVGSTGRAGLVAVLSQSDVALGELGRD